MLLAEYRIFGDMRGSALARAALAVGGDPRADARAHAPGDHRGVSDSLTHLGLKRPHCALDLHACPPLEPLEAPARLTSRLVGSSAELRKVILEGL
jgi:hypothetical protein